MKKILLGLCILQTLSVESAQRFTHYSTLLKSGIAAVRTLTQPTYKAPVRQLTDLAALKGCDALGVYSPTIGALAVTPFPELNRPQPLIAKWYTEEHSPLKDLARLFFYQNPVDLKVELTQYDKGIVQAFPPALVADLLKASEQKTALSAQEKEAHITDWYKRYTQIATTINEPYSEKSFRKKAQQFLKTFEKVSEKTSHNQTSFLLLAVLFKAAQNRSDLQTFARSHTVSLDTDTYTQDDFEKLDPCFKNGTDNYSLKYKTSHASYLTQLLYWLTTSRALATNTTQDIPTYPPKLLEPKNIPLSYKGSEYTTLCMEEALRTFINCLLYNPSTGTFDFSLLPQTIQKHCQKNNPAFYAFMQKYNNPCAPEFYKKSAPEWLALVSELPSIEYHSKNFELYGGDQILKVICHLFGIAPTESYQQLAAKLSTQERTVVLEQEQSDVNLSFVLKNSTFKVGTAYFGRVHGYFHFLTTGLDANIRGIIEEAYNQHIANDENHYRRIYSSNPKTMSLQQFKEMIDELRPAELETFICNDMYTQKILLSFSEQEKTDYLLYIFKKPEIKTMRIDFNEILLKILGTGNEQIARFIFENMNIDPSYIQGGSNMTFFHKACENKKHYSTTFIQSLINAHPKALNLQDSPGRTPLFSTLHTQNLPLIQFLLDQGADLTICDRDGNTPLHYAAKAVELYYKETLLLLKSEKCDLTLKNKEGKTALELLQNNYWVNHVHTHKDIKEYISNMPTKAPIQELTTTSDHAITTETDISQTCKPAQEEIINTAQQPTSSVFSRVIGWITGQNNQ